MANKVRSSNGEMVDFDLLKIKQQIASAPVGQDHKIRQEAVDRKLRKKTKQTYEKATTDQMIQDATVGDDVDMLDDEINNIDGDSESVKSKQKARPKE